MPDDVDEDNPALQISLPSTAEEITMAAANTLDKIEAALPQVRLLESGDAELDEIASMATSTYKDLIELGLQVESKYASEIFNSASSFLGHAVTAKTAKINSKLKRLEMQLKKAALDHKIETTKSPEEVENTVLGTGQMLDRNELLKMLTVKDESKKD